MKLFIQFKYLILLSIIALSGCGGGGGGSATATQNSSGVVGSTANMGVITQGEITAYKFTNGLVAAQIGTPITTDTNGQFDLSSLIALYTGPTVLILRDPTGNAKYFNEASAKMEPFPNGKSLRVVVNNLNNQKIAITPLTEVATVMAMSFVTTQGLTDTQAISKANNDVSYAFLGGIDPIYTIPVDVRKNIASSSNNDAVYANVLAGIAFVAQQNAIDPIAQAGVYASHILQNNNQLKQDDLGALIQAIASFNSSPPAGVFAPPISTNILPVAYGKTVTMNEDSYADIVLSGGSLDRVPVMFSIQTQPQFGRVTGTPPNLRYIPNANYNGSDSFTFTVNNGFKTSIGALVNILIAPVPDAPVAQSSVLLTAENTNATGMLRGSDADNDLLTYTIVSNPTNGLIISLNQATGEFIYKPNLNVAGVDTLTFKVNDATHVSNIATLDITVQNVNNAPTATAQVLSLNEDAYSNITLTGTDADANPLAIQLTSTPTHGTLEGIVPNLKYIPNTNFNGQDSFRFLVFDGALTSTEAVVILKVIPVNDPPVATNRTLSMNQGTNISFVFDGTDPEQDALTYSISVSPAVGSLTGALSGSLAGMSMISYVPPADFYGQANLSFSLADGNGGTATGNITFTVLPYATSAIDTDGDGLRDSEEVALGTNPLLVDTDGDGFSDFKEVVTFAFDKNVNNFRFNPLIADMPEIDIQLVSQPEIQLNYTTASGSSSTISTNRSVSSSSSWSHSSAGSSTWSSSVSHEVGVSLTLGVEEEVQIGTTGAQAANKYSASVTGHYTNTNTEGHETSTSWNDETSGENGNTRDRGASFEQNNEISTSDGDILVSAKVVNTGNVAYTLNNLFLNASYFDGTNNQPFVPIGTLKFDDPNNSQFPVFSLSPGQTSGVMTFRTSPLNVNTVKKLLSNSRGMSIRPSIYDMLDQNNVSYNFSSTGIATQTALVKIDYIGNGGRKNITKRIAVHGDASTTVNVDKILNTILGVNAVVSDIYGNPSAQGALTSVDGLANHGPNGFWIMMHGKNHGNNNMITTTYTTPSDRAAWITRGNLDPTTTSVVDDYNLSNITLNGGDILHLFYMQDTDLDGLSNVEEFFYRSDPAVKDTDFDGLEDSVEVKGWDVTWENSVHSHPTQRFYSSPTLADTDADGLSDADEANINGIDGTVRRNPRSSDTDGDSIVDSIDDKLGLVLKANVFQSLGISDLYTSVTQVPTSNANVSVSYTLPTSLYNMPNNGYSSYMVAVYRLIDPSANFSSPAHAPQNGIAPLVGDTLPCQSPAMCTWTVADIYQTSSIALNKPTVVTSFNIQGI